MKERELDEALRGLPEQGASPDFTAWVVARLDEASTPMFGGRLVWAAAAAVLVLAVALPAGLWWQQRAEQVEARAELAALRAEHEEHERALDELRERIPPRVVVGSDEQFDYVLDLDRMQRGRAAPARGRPVPARYDGGTL